MDVLNIPKTLFYNFSSTDAMTDDQINKEYEKLVEEKAKKERKRNLLKLAGKGVVTGSAAWGVKKLLDSAVNNGIGSPSGIGAIGLGLTGLGGLTALGVKLNKEEKKEVMNNKTIEEKKAELEKAEKQEGN